MFAITPASWPKLEFSICSKAPTSSISLLSVTALIRTFPIFPEAPHIPTFIDAILFIALCFLPY